MPPTKVPVVPSPAMLPNSKPHPSLFVSSPENYSPTVPRPQKINTAQVHNRLIALMAHTRRYAFKSESRLARDAGVSKSAVCRLINGHSSPSYTLVVALTRALEKQLCRVLDPREVVSTDGRYPTASVCALCGCKGCLPDAAYDEDNRLRPEYRHLQPGRWGVMTPAQAPNGRLQIVEIDVHDENQSHGRSPLKEVAISEEAHA